MTFGKNPINTLIVLLNLQGLGWIFKGWSLIDGGPGLSQSWFVTVILLCYIFLPLFRKVERRVKPIHFVFFYCAAIATEFVGISIQIFVLFFLAYYIGKRKVDLLKIKPVIWFLALIISVGIRLIGRHFFDGTILYNSVIAGLTHQVIAFAIIAIVTFMTKRYTGIQKLAGTKGVLFIEKR